MRRTANQNNPHSRGPRSVDGSSPCEAHLTLVDSLVILLQGAALILQPHRYVLWFRNKPDNLGHDCRRSRSKSLQTESKQFWICRGQPMITTPSGEAGVTHTDVYVTPSSAADNSAFDSFYGNIAVKQLQKRCGVR